MYLGADAGGRLGGEMRWRAAALVALSALVIIPAASDATQPSHALGLRVAVRPGAGSPTTRFVISFTAAHTTGRLGTAHRAYRIDASGPAAAGCRSSISAAAAPARAGTTVRVALAPGPSQRWCAGTFRGRVWDVITEPCPRGEVCPAIVPLPQMVGKFTFRVTRG
jgi:hypothetical protein